MLVHFPIALLITGAAIEWIGLPVRARTAQPHGASRIIPTSSSATVCVVIGAAAAAAAAWSGWLNADFEPQGRGVERILWFHRWLGVVLAALALLAVLVRGLAGVTRRTGLMMAYRLGLLVVAGGVAYVGHLGGSLVHGSGAVTSVLWPEPETTEPAPAPGVLAPPVPGTTGGNAPDEPTVGAPQPSAPLAMDARAVLDASCVGCHGPRRQRGRLRLDRYDDVRRVVIPGDADGSELLRRVMLPMGHDEHMPPKETLPSEEIETLRAWITAGAPWSEPAADDTTPASGSASPADPTGPASSSSAPSETAPR